MFTLTVFSDWFFSTLILLFIFIPLVTLWVFTLVDLFMRHDLRGIHKALWLLAIVLLPVIGVLIYFMTRPDDAEMRAA